MQGESWIDDILDEVQQDVETPFNWLWWSMVTAISAVAADYRLSSLNGKVVWRANLYVMLLGESGLGKGFGINLCKLLVNQADVTRVIAGRSSIQAIVTELSKATTNANGKPPIMDSRGLVINGELSSAIIADVDSLAILTDLYDGHYNPEWNNLLKISGKEKLKRPYITTLFGSSPAHFYDSIPAANIEGGYIARNLIVFEEKRSRNLDLLDDPDQLVTKDLDGYIIPKYCEHLRTISGGAGQITYTRPAQLMLNSWRHKWRETQVKEKTGFMNRVPDHVLKVAMCLCLARYNSNLVINEFDVEESIKRVTDLIYANKMAGTGTKIVNDAVFIHSKTVLNLLIAAENQQLPRRLLLSRSYPYGLCDTITLDKIIDTYMEMGFVERERHVAGSATDWIIKLAGEPLAEYKKRTKPNV